MGKLSAVAKAAKEIAKKAKNESFDYKRKLKKELSNTPLVASPSTKARKKIMDRVEEVEKNIALENPYLTYEDRVKLLGGKYKKGGKVKQMKKGGKVSSCSKRADGCAVKGKTKGRMV
jgi:hypothetical protein